MLRGLFVTGTDTGVGKTAVAAALVVRARSLGRVAYWKPIQTGIEQDDDTATVRHLASCNEGETFDRRIRLPHPVSPHLAAERAGVRLSVAKIATMVEAQPDGCRWIVEGAGGALVPLNDTETMADLMARLALPVIVVARSSLGTINHTLLTLEALRRREIAISGIVLVGEKNPDNRQAIERFGHVPVIAEMPVMSPLTPEALQAWAADQLNMLC